jgi:alkanesulfonate monooxygenase SsuD/methylene tetrahydromethanopterin reductase-like flavin-dependent oxidoreductase (luciferase family)
VVRFAGVASSPKPLRPPGVPIIVGGSSVAAARRAGTLGDGYCPYVGEAQLGGLLAAMREASSYAGRDDTSIEITRPVAPDVDARTLRALLRLGVGRVVVSVRDARPDVLERVIRSTVDVVRAI